MRAGGGGGAKARWKFYMMCAGSSEPSLVANSISTQISYAGSNVPYACRKQNGRLYYSGKERKKCFYFFFILFDRSVTFYASMFCDSTCIADYVILSSIFFFRRSLKWVRPILRYSLSNGLDLDQWTSSTCLLRKVKINNTRTILNFIFKILSVMEIIFCIRE